METKLYVGNLSEDTSVDELRKRFSEVGSVAEVELVSDRGSGRMRGYGFVTMKTEADARSAITKLHGAMFEGRPLRVNEAGENHREDKAEKAAREALRVKITFQFRERTNMTYELDCAGTPLVLKMFPTSLEGGGEQWRIEARTPTSPDAVEASAPTRADALEQISNAWRNAHVDWPQIIDLMRSVNAI